MSEDLKAKLGDGRCANCRQPVANAGAPFYRVRIDIGLIDVAAVRRRYGLSLFLGSDALADVFDTGAPLVSFTDEHNAGASFWEVRLCTACYCDQVVLPELVERATAGAAVEPA